MCRKRQADLTELRATSVFNHGETDMGDKGSKDKGKKRTTEKGPAWSEGKTKIEKVKE